MIVDSVGAVDTLYYDLDSLDATVYWHSFTYTSIDTVTFYNTEAYIYSYDYDLLNDEYKLMISSEGLYSLDLLMVIHCGPEFIVRTLQSIHMIRKIN